MIITENLKCETLVNPKGIDVTSPRFNWQINSLARGVKQTAYQIIVASSLDKLSREEGDLWNSGRLASDRSILVVYAGTPLQSRQQCFWKVKTWTNLGETDWSTPASFTMGLLQASDWKAKWIGLDRAFSWDSVSKFARLSARYLRKEISASKDIKRATIYVSGLGLYELYINGDKIGDQVLAPGPTDYSKTILYNAFDVTPQLKGGKNAIGVVLGNGRFFTMRQAYKPQKWHDFGFPRMLLQLEIEYNDGTKQIVASDESWKATADGPIRTNNEYDGEEYDARKELNGWNKKEFNDAAWLQVDLMKTPGGMLKAQMNPFMKVMESIKPVSIKKLSSNRYVLDMGQNMAGWLKMNVKGEKGAAVTLRFAESLQPNGEPYVANLRDAKVTDVYTLKGDGKETWNPTFVTHGFRYVEITGYPGKPKLDDFAGEVVYDDLQTTGSLETSNSVINQVHKNAYWGIRSNYKGMPVDCPQRNERQPWLGDRTMGAYGESFLFDNNAFYAKWMNDLADAQTAEGSIPDVAPSFWFYYKDNMTWPGAFLTVSDMLYRQYGNKAPIEKHYAAMKKWLAYMKGKYMTPEYIVTKDSYGDWCVPPESPKLIHSQDSMRNTDPQLLATAYYYYFMDVMQRFASLTGHDEDIAGFAAEAVKVKAAFNKKFYHPSTAQYSNNTVTANLLPLAFHLVATSDSEKVFQNIVQKIQVQNGGHISTGVIGTQWLMRWLTLFGRGDIAYKLASNTTYPSWGYMVKNGATTIWELWNGNTADPAMNSQNHVMLLGDLLIWMYEDLGGIQSDATDVGFKKIIMKPSFVKELTFVNASHDSPYGKIESNWKREGNSLSWNVTVPANATALLYVPAGSTDAVKEDGKRIDAAQGVKFLRMENGSAVIQIGSGRYSFTTSSGTAGMGVN
ncbi:glycoside hydrolase family 78 protein [Flavisolibacter ginsenosidimutans]|uniref:glycoside hydrolase family 78 protein n=1 Tax=Flavisolibacter ginsenosidimutans TaxID=661481 RepID=UPI0031F01AC4